MDHLPWVMLGLHSAHMEDLNVSPDLTLTDHTSIPNDGPFGMLEAVSKGFVLDVGAHREHITLDRLKPRNLVASRVVLLAEFPHLSSFQGV